MLAIAGGVMLGVFGVVALIWTGNKVYDWYLYHFNFDKWCER